MCPIKANINIQSKRHLTEGHPISLPMDRGSPIRPRSAPSSANTSQLSVRSSRLNVGERGVGSTGVGIGGDKDVRRGIAMARNGWGMRSGAVGSNPTGRMNMDNSSSSSRKDMKPGQHACMRI